MSDSHDEVDFGAAEEQGNDYYAGDSQDSANDCAGGDDSSDMSEE